VVGGSGGSAVYASGDFTSIGGESRNHIAAIDATTGAATAWDPSANDVVSALAVGGSDGSTVYAGGYFTSIGGQLRNHVVALDATSGTATGWDPNANAWVGALAVSGPTVYAGGLFQSIGGSGRNYIAALDATTGAATAWNPNASSTVSALAVIGSTIYAGGNFHAIGGEARSGVAALDATTGSATDWNPNVDLDVYALAVDGTTVHVGGGFFSVDGLAQSFIAAIEDPTLDVPAGSNVSSVASRLENLPNPFRTSTRITFALRSDGRVTLEVFDLAGRLVATLMRDERATVGLHQVEFRHPGLPSGLYLSRLRVDRDLLTRKMLVMQ
jgi:hypothetical protein